MQFGIFFLMGSPGMEPSEHVYRRMLDHIVLAEELGYDSVWIAEHHFSNYGYIPNPLMVAVRAAAETSRIRIGTAVLVLPFWHPLRLAEEIAMADQLTGGRLDVGVARGYQPYEFARFGLSFEDARSLSEETLDILLRALSEVGFSYPGRHYRIDETTVFPRPLQRPHPPIWLGAQSEESFDAAVRFGLPAFTSISGRPIDNLVRNWNWYTAARERHGASGPARFALQQHSCVLPTDDEASRYMAPFLYSRRQVGNLRAGTERVERGFSQELPVEGEPTLDQLFATHTLSGTPDTVRRKIDRYLEVAPITLLNCAFEMGDMPEHVVTDSMRLLAADVIPAYRDR
jgi:alkanesulfonate monooxygenase SsuD/methylene tetrahydromethanopterin reductase-like flavin-dependent oxidoreductase (luciferase family)